MMSYLTRLPEDVRSHIDAYYNPHREYFTQNVVRNHALWRMAWNRTWERYNQQENHVMTALLEFLFTEWGVHPPECEVLTWVYHTRFLPANVTFMMQPAISCTKICVYGPDHDGNITQLYYLKHYTQHQHRVLTSLLEDENDMYLTYWNSTRTSWLYQFMPLHAYPGFMSFAPSVPPADTDMLLWWMA